MSKHRVMNVYSVTWLSDGDDEVALVAADTIPRAIETVQNCLPEGERPDVRDFDRACAQRCEVTVVGDGPNLYEIRESRLGRKFFVLAPTPEAAIQAIRDSYDEAIGIGSVTLDGEDVMVDNDA